MQTSSVILVDGNNIGFAALLAAKQRLSAGNIDTTGVYGFLRSLHVIRREFAGDLIILWDGNSWRHQAALTEGVVYKGTREVTEQQVDNRAIWRQSRAMLLPAIKHLGVTQIVAENLEADDLAARFRKNQKWDHVLLVSSDADWLALVNEKTQVWDHRKERRTTVANFKAITGLDHPRQLVEVKALTGDTSDNIPGVGGIGEKTAKELLVTFGSVQGFLNACLGDPEVRKTAPSRALKLLDDPEKRRIFESNLKLIDLDHPEAPLPSKVNITKGEYSVDAFQRFCEELAFLSILRDMNRFVAPFTSA